ncbi:hypothetical protein BJV77DRAFT_1030981 [Russula vinacea]|nr:hypothetical protein BJV77DRAFT_1030981 [Russula vinacea]
MGFSARSWVRTASEYRYYKSFVPHLTWIHSTSSPYSVAVMNLYLGSRRSMASSSTAAAADPVKEDFPEALTYRYNDNSAWVPAAKSHEEAIDLAKHAYPELRGIRRDRITFHTTGKSSIACITPAAWQLVYSYTAAAAVLREKEERYLQQREQPSTEPSGNRLRQMMSFVRGTDS